MSRRSSTWRSATSVSTTSAAPPSTIRLRLLFLHTFLGAGSGPGTPAQQAVQAALLSEVGVPLADQVPPVAERLGLYDDVARPGKGSPIFATAARLARDPRAIRTWLLGHLGALRAGELTLDEVP
ncbi:MAG TPA: hypothetical protein VMD59_05255 [Acidimicrobiales bacterium]|nr:hypothetical protein [Acidimicrobiales bacterium]